MKYLELFTEQKNKWKDLLEQDEWYFTKFRENLINTIPMDEIEECLNDLIYIIKNNNDEFYCSELLETIFALCIKYNSTELSKKLVESLDSFDKRFKENGYINNIIIDIKRLLSVE